MNIYSSQKNASMRSSSGVSKPLLIALIAGIAVIAVVVVIAGVGGFMMIGPTGQAPPNQPSVQQPPQPQEFFISQPLGSAFPDNDLNFDPPDVTISVGDTVTWMNDDENIHTATHRGDPALFDSETVEAGEQFSVTFSEAGEFQYFCKFHPWMGGVVNVQN